MSNLSHLPELWRKSGLSQREFCERKGIPLPTFSYWRAKELHAQELPFKPEPVNTFTQLVVKDSIGEQCIEIQYPSGTVIRIPL